MSEEEHMRELQIEKDYRRASLASLSQGGEIQSFKKSPSSASLASLAKNPSSATLASMAKSPSSASLARIEEVEFDDEIGGEQNNAFETSAL